jgi:hypothetical protein
MCVEIAKFFNSTEHPYVLPTCQVTAALLNGASTALGYAFEAVDRLERRVGILVEPYASPTVANVSRAFVRSAPYIGISLLLPNSLSYVVCGGIFAYKAITTSTAGSTALTDLCNGISFATLISGTNNIRHGLQERRILRTAWGLTEVTFAGYSLYRQFN